MDKEIKNHYKLLSKFKGIAKLVVLALVLTLAHQSIAGMASDNYKIWLDTFDTGGGTASSSTLRASTSMTGLSAVQSQSSNFSEYTLFTGIEDEPTVGFSVNSVSLDFGQLSPQITRVTTHTFSAFTNAKEGYTIKVYGQSLHSVDHTIEAIGATASSLTIGSEQFGINLVRNTLPSVGANPLGGIGLASSNYNQANKFAFSNGDTIAYAESYSYQTDYTVTAIVNIADDTPAGAYETVLTYEFIPVF